MFLSIRPKRVNKYSQGDDDDDDDYEDENKLEKSESDSSYAMMTLLIM
jgi:hypothetical protein